MAKIQHLIAREILDSRGFPTVEADVILDNGVLGRAAVPSGASTGIHEALELRDGDKNRYLGKGVTKAVANLNGILAKAIHGLNPDDILLVDRTLIAADGTANKTNLGANSVLAASLAAAKASAVDQKIDFALWIQKQGAALGITSSPRIPLPLMNIINGGAHADNGLDIQEFMIVPHGFSTFKESIRAGAEVFHHLKKILASEALTTAVGDEGGFAPKLKSNESAIQYVLRAIEAAGYQAGDQIALALDVAASEFYKEGRYHFKDPNVGTVDTEELVKYFANLAEKYPIVSIEDACAEDDWNTWKVLTQKLGSRLQLVGDDLFVTQMARLQKGIDEKVANSILIKLNQVGSLSETLQTMALAAKNNYTSVTSHRSGETEDTTIAHLAVGTGCGQIKTGSASRSERVAKYNELLRLEEKHGFSFAADAMSIRNSMQGRH